jgi:alpha-galactosidase
LGNQGHTYGISRWLPFHGQGVYPTSNDTSYYIRSHFAPGFAIVVDVRAPRIDWETLRRMGAQWREVADCMLGDYYPLTPYSLEADQWIAWQFDRPDRGDGMIQAFRRDRCREKLQALRLYGLDPVASYDFEDLDTGVTVRLSGSQLLSHGLPIAVEARPGASLISYRRVD